MWRANINPAAQTYEMAAKAIFRGYASLGDQIQRAAISISNNIAEGSERGTKQELLTLLYIARGSTGEVGSMLCLLEPSSGDLKFQG